MCTPRNVRAQVAAPRTCNVQMAWGSSRPRCLEAPPLPLLPPSPLEAAPLEAAPLAAAAAGAGCAPLLAAPSADSSSAERSGVGRVRVVQSSCSP